jgi:hypothetical protein
LNNSGMIIFMFERPTQICWNFSMHKVTFKAKPPPSHHKGGEFQPGHTLHIQNAASISVTKIVSPPLVPSSHFQQFVLAAPPLRTAHAGPIIVVRGQNQTSRVKIILQFETQRGGRRDKNVKCFRRISLPSNLVKLKRCNLLFSLRLCAPLRPSPLPLPPSLPINLSLLV